MAFADPVTVTVNAVAKVMARVISSGKSATYQLADETFKLTVSHTITKDGRVRSMIRLDQRAIVADPLSTENEYKTLSSYYVIDRPDYGFTLAQVQQHTAGLFAWLDATAIGKIYGQES